MAIKRTRRSKKSKRSRRRRSSRRTWRQSGGNIEAFTNIGASLITSPVQFDLTVMLEPGLKANPAGIDVPMEKAQALPHVYWPSPTAGELYTVICWDPDAPEKSFLHWLVVNCGGKGPESGETVQPWNGPSPPKDQTHRYYIRVFKQNNKIAVPTIASRGGFDVDSFAQQNGLTPMADRMMRVKGV